MQTTRKISLAVGLLLVGMNVANGASGTTCAPDAVAAGSTCLDTYEASVWRIPSPTTTNAPLVRKVKEGVATVDELTAGGATQLGLFTDDYAPCSNDGQSCADDIYAASLPSTIPSTHITWFQAQAACANADKRLPSSAEWQVGANGTPDAGPDNGITQCNSASGQLVGTGSRSACVSARGAFDMVGNVEEWVADWVPLSMQCTSWGSLSDDRMCLSGASPFVGGPGALTRGGSFVDGPSAGPLAVVGGRRPAVTFGFIGFRCARNSPGPLPAEVDAGVRVSRSGGNAVLTWNLADGATASQVLRGRVSRLPVGSHVADERCLIDNTRADVLTDPEIPANGDGFWYLVRGQNEAGKGSYGFEEAHGVPVALRASTTCP